ncbi:hypothetical protein B0H19DRAFT_1015201 [Mycena capillaripes]|nr:hypothetical protein B0H19DRAFT_1015201 [Mycena capillaripes]
MGDAPRTKRRRTNDSEDASETETPLMRSAEYWFDDGNIILQVESTQFRLTKSMLSMHSNVFRDMFTVPLPPDEPTVENCPVVILTGDTAKDWIHFLGVVYPKCFVEEAPRMEVIAGVLRLSKKYDFPIFRKDCIRRLKMELPTTLEELDDLTSTWTLIQDENDIFFTIVSLAREIGLYSILPLVYCFMVTINDKIYIPRILDTTDASLSDGDRLACLRGYHVLQELQSMTTMAWLDLNKPHIPCATCQHPDKCLSVVKEIICDLSGIHPPQIWIIDDWSEEWENSLCGRCGKKAKEVFEAGRIKCWKELPAAFGLPGWEELKSIDFE